MNSAANPLLYHRLRAAARAQHLDIFGGLHPDPHEGLPEGTQTLLLLGPDEPGHWAHLQAQPEFSDGAPDPIDRWSRRIITGLAAALSGTPLFPFTKPYLPFYDWALQSGRAFHSPVQLLVHDQAGLMVSYRGAVALSDHIPLPTPSGQSPCEGCARPCVSACPADALDAQGYRLEDCHAWLSTASGTSCMTQGCAVRRCCPVSESYGRVAEQSAYHMKVFHPQ